ncbi:unnamed protein product [Didymodactylos carnosus]|uniref:Uncharacterized protein n=1 Tax=Didymodactylos carnosus TaxID=1234261 RepID=A0A814RNV5_9BILA|nr:unnamed protein product [Didymodactylos carnosus]CAF1223736.1 unnamed protein product [Didymodactylos carnosus]CAF3899549.1 unnamed protein product [Didymodactylos carnosus]CAF4031983.1 unnamed protein product [Didymodactylos carnosus]
MSTVTDNSLPTTIPHIDVFKPLDAMHNIEKITNNSNLFTFLRDSIELKHEFTKGLVKEELKEMIEETKEPTRCILLQKVLELEENQTTLLAATILKDKHVRQTWVIKGMHRNGKFDLVEVHAIQKKEIDKQKLFGYGLAYISLGKMLESNENAPGGLEALKTLCRPVKEEPADVFYSCIMKDLYDKGLPM